MIDPIMPSLYSAHPDRGLAANDGQLRPDEVDGFFANASEDVEELDEREAIRAEGEIVGRMDEGPHPDPEKDLRTQRMKSKADDPPANDDAPSSLTQAYEREAMKPDPSRAAPALPRAVTPADVLAGWRTEGPVERIATGFPTLDETCRGGLVFGRRHYLVGAPGAGKTALANVIGRRLLNLGLVVGILAIDEDPEDLLVRYAQMVCGLSQADCDRREPDILEVAEEQLAPLRLRMYGPQFSIESAADDLAAYSKSEGKRAAYIIDSLQTATCELERVSAMGGKPFAALQSLDARVAAIRSVTTAHRFATMTVSEMNRGAYRSQDAAQNSNSMAAAKGTGAVEYSAQLLLSLRSVRGSPDLVHVEVTKNRGGRSGGELYLQLDRAHHDLTETDAPVEGDGLADNRKLSELVQAVRLALVENAPVTGKTGMRAVLRERDVQFRNADLDAALLRLAQEIRNEGTEARPKWRLASAAQEPAPAEVERKR